MKEEYDENCSLLDIQELLQKQVIYFFKSYFFITIYLQPVKSCLKRKREPSLSSVEAEEEVPEKKITYDDNAGDPTSNKKEYIVEGEGEIKADYTEIFNLTQEELLVSFYFDLFTTKHELI